MVKILFVIYFIFINFLYAQDTGAEQQKANSKAKSDAAVTEPTSAPPAIPLPEPTPLIIEQETVIEPFYKFDMKISEKNRLYSSLGVNDKWYDDAKEDNANLSQVQKTLIDSSKKCLTSLSPDKRTDLNCKNVGVSALALDVYANRYSELVAKEQEDFKKGTGGRGASEQDMSVHLTRGKQLELMQDHSKEYKENASLILGGTLINLFKTKQKDFPAFIEAVKKEFNNKNIVATAYGEKNLNESNFLIKKLDSNSLHNTANNNGWTNQQKIEKFQKLLNSKTETSTPDDLLTSKQILSSNDATGFSGLPASNLQNADSTNDKEPDSTARGIEAIVKDELAKRDREQAVIKAKEKELEEAAAKKAASSSGASNSGDSSPAASGANSMSALNSANNSEQQRKEKEREALRKKWEEMRKYGKPLIKTDPKASRINTARGRTGTVANRYRIPRLYRDQKDDDDDKGSRATIERKRPYGDSGNTKEGAAQRYARNYYNNNTGQVPQTLSPADAKRQRFGDMVNFARQKSLTENANTAETVGRYVDIMEIPRVILDHYYRDKGALKDAPAESASW